ncbi:MAG: fasciclin domain-containing protein [Microcoleaceae cyanobacterium]
MNHKSHYSLKPVTSLLSLLTCSLSLGLAARTAFAEKPQPIISQLPTEVIEGVGGANLTQVMSSDNRFTILRTLLRTTGLLNQLQQGESWTLFAPTDEAFKALPEQILASLMQPENINQLTNLLKYHVIPGRMNATELSSGKIESLQGNPLNVEVGSDQVRVEEATIIEPDIQASNGVIHVIDKVMILPE